MENIMSWLKTRHSLRQFIKFSISGTSASIAEILVFSVLASVLFFKTLYANAIAIGVSMVVGYLLNRHFTFRHHRVHPSGIFLFILLNVWNVLFESFFIDLLAATGFWHKIPAKILTLLVCTGWNYFAYKYVIFRHHPAA